jgi:sugar lactone lactonase YvrE
MGGLLAIDGGQQAVSANAATNGLGTTSSVAVTATGTGYIADPTNNRIVVIPSITTVPGTQTVIGPSIAVTNIVYGQTTSTGVAQTLSGPMGVAVDAANNVYISDTGNNRILKYNPLTKTAVVLGSYLWIPGSICDGGIVPAASDCVFQGYSTQAPGSTTIVSSFGASGVASNVSILNEPGGPVTATTPPPQYKFKAPQGLAVDQWDNVYVADTGNAAIVEIPGDVKLGGATPLFQYAGAPTFTQPVAVAVDSKGFIYVADQQNLSGEIVRIPPGGGDLQPASSGPTSALSVVSSLPLFGGIGINNPNGVAVDSAGNVFVSDSSGNAVWEAPAVGPPKRPSFHAQLYWAEFSGRPCSGREWEPVCGGLGEQTNPEHEPGEPDRSVRNRAGETRSFWYIRYPGRMPGSGRQYPLHWRVDGHEHRQPACRSELSIRHDIRGRESLLQFHDHLQQHNFPRHRRNPGNPAGQHLHHLAALHSIGHRRERRCDPLREWTSSAINSDGGLDG